MSAMAAIATEIGWQTNSAGMLTSDDGRYLIVDTPKNRWVLLTITNGDVSQINVFDTLPEALQAEKL